MGQKLDAFLQFNEKDILSDAGKVTHIVAVALAETEFEKYRLKQDALFERDFDKILNLIDIPKNIESPTEGGKKLNHKNTISVFTEILICTASNYHFFQFNKIIPIIT